MFEVLTLDEITDALVAAYKNRFPTHDVSKLSDNWKRQRVTALAAFMNQAHIQSVGDDMLPDLASGTALDRWATLVNLTRKAATSAYKADSLRLRGTAASTFTSGDELTHSDGTSYMLNESGSIPAAGFIDVDVIAIDTGSVTRKTAGEVLTFVSAPSGIQSTAEIQLDLDEGGDDEELDGALRDRVLAKIAQPGMGGNANDYEQWALEEEGVAEAYVYPIRQGLGTVDVAVLRSGTGDDRLFGTSELTDVETAMDAKRPVAIADFRVIEVIADPRDIEVTLEQEEEAQYNRDWDDTTPLVVATWTAGTRALVFTLDRPDDMLVGDRLIYKGAANAGFELEIESLSSTNAVILKAPTSSVQAADLAANPPASPNNVYSGGPIIEPVRAAIQSYVDNLGPARGTTAQGNWDDVLRTIRLRAACIEPDGVLEGTVVAPVANVTPDANEPNSTIDLITLRQLFVRYE